MSGTRVVDDGWVVDGGARLTDLDFAGLDFADLDFAGLEFVNPDSAEDVGDSDRQAPRDGQAPRGPRADAIGFARFLASQLGAPAGGVQAAALDEVVVADLDDDGLLAALRASQELANWATARQMVVLGELAARRGGARFGSIRCRGVCDEVALELAITRGSAERRVGSALILTGELPATLEAMHAGTMDARKADVLIEAVTDLPAETRRAVEADLVVQAAG